MQHHRGTLLMCHKDCSSADFSNHIEEGLVNLDSELVDTDAAIPDTVYRERIDIGEVDENTVTIANTSNRSPPASHGVHATRSAVTKTTGPQHRQLSILVFLSVSIAAVLIVAGVWMMQGSNTAREVVTTVPTTMAPTTLSPTAAPVTAAPTHAPTSAPTLAPTSAPTVENLFVPVNPVPQRRSRSYFNYNEGDRQYGPRNWRQINMHGTYFQEFGTNGFGAWKGHMEDHVANTTINRCGVSGKQSPIDLYQTTGEESECTATHQIRTRRSVYRLSSKEIQKVIEPNKLRLILPRRKCLDLDDDSCGALRPPMADFPNWSSTLTHYSDLLNLDIKIPGEHTIQGETFDAEIQMLHLHLEAGRMAYIGIPVRAKHDGFNQEYQDLLDHFQTTYDDDMAACGEGNRRLRTAGEALRSNLNSTDDSTQPRLLQGEGSFDPYTDFMKTVFFYRYHGSNTEPPCFPITWFVMTTPLVIDFHQLRQTKTLLFTHVDSRCRKTSVHNKEQSVVRPIQPLGIVPPENKRREVMLCKVGDFKPDPQ